MPDPVARLNTALQGRYRVERQLGEGGMATVYLAEDLKHRRRVALKVLKPELAAVVGASRFLAEIETTANLQHPHILPLFDSGEADGLLFYVMPHVEGENLRARLDREHQLPVDEAVQIAANVAEALDYAHRQGVIHRDIKPANILLLDGKPVIADFGIALAVSHAGSGRLTETGLSLGTPHYMSPEQATGDQTVGPATDIWALGCALYEMLLGEPPYTGSTPQAVLGKIITAEPASITGSRRSVPPNVDAAIRRALEKVPADRFGTARDLGAALADESFRHGAQHRSGARSVRRAVLQGAAIVLVTAAASLAAPWSSLRRPSQSAVPPVVRASIPVPHGLRGGGLPYAISRDGRMLALATLDSAGQAIIVLRRLSDGDTRPVPGTEGGIHPTFSPEGGWLAFARNDSLLKVPLAGGRPLLVTRGVAGINAPEGVVAQPSWAQDGTLVFVSHSPPGPVFTPTDAIYRVSDSGGQPELITSPGRDGQSHRWPELLPDGRSLLFTAYSNVWGDSEVRILDLATGDSRTLVAPGAHGRFVESIGQILYGGPDQALYALPFDPGRGVATGPAVRVLAPVAVTTGGGPTRFAVSADGIAVYQAGAVTTGSNLVLAYRDGRREVLPIPPGQFFEPRFSGSGRRITFGRAAQIYAYHLQLGNLRALTSEGNNWGAFWTGDEFITFASSERPGTRGFDVFRQSLDRNALPSDAPQQLLALEGGQWPHAWTGDGRLIVADIQPPRQSDILVLSFAGDSVSRVPYLEAEWYENAPTLSPDERWLAYVSDESGEFEVYARSFPEPGERIPVSESGGYGPAWSPNGDRIYYHVGTELRAAHVRASASLQVLGRETVITGIQADGGLANRRQYDVHPSGDPFIVKVPVSGAGFSSSELTVAVSWFEEIRQLIGS